MRGSLLTTAEVARLLRVPSRTYRPLSRMMLVLRAARLAIAIAALTSTPTPQSGPWLTADDVAALLKVPRRSVYALVDGGWLPCQKIGLRRIRFNEEHLAELYRRSAEAAS